MVVQLDLELEYHIHYTNTKREVFMTGGSHTTSSKIIEKIDGSKSLFSTYTKIKNVHLKNEYPKKYNPIPSEGDYGGGSLNRYFTQKANNLNGELFEISKEDFGKKNTLFRYVKISWRLTGKKSEVIRDNTRTINTFSIQEETKSYEKYYLPHNYGKHQRVR